MPARAVTLVVALCLHDEAALLPLGQLVAVWAPWAPTERHDVPVAVCAEVAALLLPVPRAMPP